MIILNAVLDAKKGKEEELEAALRAMIPQTAKEAGVLEYRLHRSRENAGRYFFYEKYRDQAAVDLHGRTPYLQALFARFDELLAGAPSVETYEFLDGAPE